MVPLTKIYSHAAILVNTSEQVTLNAQNKSSATTGIGDGELGEDTLFVVPFPYKPFAERSSILISSSLPSETQASKSRSISILLLSPTPNLSVNPSKLLAFNFY